VPATEIVFYREEGKVFFIEWLKAQPVAAQRKCLSYLRLLEAEGHALRRPVADFLHDGIYELRPTIQGVHYRILYFFHGKNFVVVSHGITKEAEIPAIEIARALARKSRYEASPEAHTFRS